MVAYLARGLITLGQKVVLYSPESTSLAGVEHVSTLDRAIPLDLGVYKTPPNVPEHIGAIMRGLRERYRPGDIIHLNHFQHYSLLAESLLGANIIETAHLTKVGSSPCIYPSFALKASVNKPGIVIPHGIDLEVFRPIDPSSTEDFVFFAGNIAPEKGLHLLEAICEASDKRLVLAGPEPQTDFGRRMVSDHDYLGELGPEALANVYNSASVSGFLSKYVEPFGLAAVEALACGSPVLTTGNGGLGDTVVDGVTGFFVSSLYDGIEAMKRIPEISREACAERGARYGLDQMAQRVLEAYRLYYA